MIKRKKTKIVATLGPAISSKEMIKEMMFAGVNVFRVNFSHADYEDVKTRIRYIRELNEENNFHVAVLADLQGPKLRVGVMKEGVVLNSGDHFTFTTEHNFIMQTFYFNIFCNLAHLAAHFMKFLRIHCNTCIE